VKKEDKVKKEERAKKAAAAKKPRVAPVTKQDPQDEGQCSACGTGRELLLQV